MPFGVAGRRLMLLGAIGCRWASLGVVGHRWTFLTSLDAARCRWTSLDPSINDPRQDHNRASGHQHYTVVGRRWALLAAVGRHWTPLDAVGRCWASLGIAATVGRVPLSLCVVHCVHSKLLPKLTMILPWARGPCLMPTYTCSDVDPPTHTLLLG